MEAKERRREPPMRCANCQKKIRSSNTCPYCGRNPWTDVASDEFAAKDGVLYRYNGEEKDVTLPAGLHTVSGGAFENTAVRSVILPEGVVRIESYAFEDCLSLNCVTFPASLRLVEENAFASCPHLAYVLLPDACEVHPAAFPPATKIEKTP